MHKPFLQTGILFCALSVALGAFAAHGLKQILLPDALAVFETGVRYQFFHSIALVITGILYQVANQKYCLWAGRLFVIGILLFSISLYTLSLLLPDFRWIGAITPLGGLSFIFGWLVLLLSIRLKK